MELIWNHTLGTVLGYLPRLFFAILITIFGFVLGNFVRTVVERTLRLIKFENLTRNSKIHLFLKNAEITHKFEDILGIALKWLIVVIFFISATDLAGLTSVAGILTSILSYLPRLLSALIVLVLGVLLAGLVESLVKGSLTSVDLKTARLMGKISSYSIVVITTLAAFSEMGIAKNFIDILFVGFVAMLSLGFGLALGLGAKDLISDILTDWYKQVKKELKK